MFNPETKSSASLLRYNHLLLWIDFVKTFLKLNSSATECVSACSQGQICKHVLEHSITAILRQGTSQCLHKWLNWLCCAKGSLRFREHKAISSEQADTFWQTVKLQNPLRFKKSKVAVFIHSSPLFYWFIQNEVFSQADTNQTKTYVFS